MTPNKRIFLNIVATYCRSLLALLCGLFGSRWVLMTLGQEDFGLYGVVGGLVAFIGIVNTRLTAFVSVLFTPSIRIDTIHAKRREGHADYWPCNECCTG